MGALPWAQPALCTPDLLNFVLICNIADGLLDYAKVIAYLATHSQTNTYHLHKTDDIQQLVDLPHKHFLIVCHVGL